MLFSILFSAGMLSFASPDGSQEPLVDSLDAVTVTADRGVIVSRTDTISFNNSSDLSDALMSCPGLYVNDNGGIAGLKSVSLRGLGSAHTVIYVDGVKVGNLQSGQNDLGMLDFAVLESIVVDYAQNSVSLKTARPEFRMSPVAGNVRMHAGSFGTYLPSARLDFRLSDNYSLSASSSGIFSKGNFKCADGSRRANNDISQVRAGLDLWGIISGGDMHVKAYYNDASRGTPGSVSWPSDDRQKDRNAFLQGVLRKRFTDVYSMNISAKGAYDNIFYTSSYGDSRYGQTDIQLNTSHYFRVSDNWNLSAAADLQWDALKSTNYTAARTSLLAALSSSYLSEMISADLAVEYYGTFDKGALSRHAWSPSLDIRASLTEGLDLVAFGRRAYRVPTFNELYYVGYGNPQLSPEDAWLTDVGVEYTFIRQLQNGYSMQLKAKVDAFYNYLTDKIISAPTEADPNIWAPYNLGEVRSVGTDAVCGAMFLLGDWKAGADLKYTFQSAVDKITGDYVPYIAKHTFCADIDASWKKWMMSIIWQMRAGRSDSYGNMPDWNTLSASLSRSFAFDRAGAMRLNITVRNILDCRYELSSGYPMPGRSLTGGIEYRF